MRAKKLDMIIQKSLVYISIQLITLWNIFTLLGSDQESVKMDFIGIIILTAIFFFYGYKTIQLLKTQPDKEGAREY